MAENTFTYLLYISENDALEKTIFLGAGEDPIKLYNNALNPQTAIKSIKSLILKWLGRIDSNLNEQEQREMDYAFTRNPETEFSYSINGMTLYLKKIRKF